MHTIKPFGLVAWLAAVILLGQGLAAADFAVSNSGFTAYRINGVNNPTLTLERGKIYTFAVAAPGHPFWIKTNAVTGTGSAYNVGLTQNGIGSGTLTFTVPETAPDTLVYICQFHSAMTGTLKIISAPATPAVLSAAERLPNGDFQFAVQGTPDRQQEVLRASIVTPNQWEQVATTNTPTGAFVFKDTNTVGSAVWFYRVAQ